MSASPSPPAKEERHSRHRRRPDHRQDRSQDRRQDRRQDQRQDHRQDRHQDRSQKHERAPVKRFERREKAPDPNSPFAKLAALKAQLEADAKERR
jgi:ATP-dependent RNA helicase SUPV3L1/SUV3